MGIVQGIHIWVIMQCYHITLSVYTYTTPINALSTGQKARLYLRNMMDCRSFRKCSDSNHLFIYRLSFNLTLWTLHKAKLSMGLEWPDASLLYILCK